MSLFEFSLSQIRGQLTRKSLRTFDVRTSELITFSIVFVSEKKLENCQNLLIFKKSFVAEPIWFFAMEP